jgi:hypothetical protein
VLFRVFVFTLFLLSSSRTGSVALCYPWQRTHFVSLLFACFKPSPFAFHLSRSIRSTRSACFFSIFEQIRHQKQFDRANVDLRRNSHGLLLFSSLFPLQPNPRPFCRSCTPLNYSQSVLTRSLVSGNCCSLLAGSVFRS